MAILNHMMIWDFWFTGVRSGRGAVSTFYAGHTASEQEAFDRLISEGRKDRTVSDPGIPAAKIRLR